MLRLSPKQLDKLTLRQFFYKLKGFSEIQENQTKTAYDTARLTAALVLNSFTNETVNPTDLIRFGWEKPKIIPPADPDLFNRRVQQIRKDKGLKE